MRCDGNSVLMDVDSCNTDGAMPSGNFTSPVQPIADEELGNADSMERILAQELLRMTPQDREIINEEIHGVASLAINEHQTPNFVPQKLAELDHILWQHHGSNKNGALVMAQSLNSSFISEYNFRLAFLRAEFFDVEKAALRMNNYFELVLELYGPNALMRPITLADFSNDELALLKEGAFQILPGRDCVGRLIHGIFDDFGENYSQVARAKVTLYLFCAAAEDEVTQKRGGVLMLYQMNPSSRMFSQPQESMVVQRILLSVPLRMSALHSCFPPLPIFNFVKAMALAAGGPQNRARARFHSGSPMECNYHLQTFGIPPENLPINTNTGKAKVQNHLKWIGIRQSKEQRLLLLTDLTEARDTMIERPNFQDVLLGRGKPILHHRGNVAMRELVASKIDDYMDPLAIKSQKEELIRSTVVQIKQAGGRFLKEDVNYGWWYVVDDVMARRKVSIYFRDLQSQAVGMAKEKRRQQEQQQLASTTMAGSSLSQSQVQQQLVLDSSTYGFCLRQKYPETCLPSDCL